MDDGNLTFGILIDTKFWKFEFVAIYYYWSINWNFLIYRCDSIFFEIERVRFVF